jgi:hypothetical protein
MTPNVSLQPIGSLAWAFIDNNLFFTREIGFNYKNALKRVTGSDLSLAIPYGMLNSDSNRLIVDFEDEYLYAPYSTALNGLRDLELIDDNTIIRFHGFERKASLVFKEIVKFEKQELLNGLERDLEYTFKSWGR